MINSSCFKSKVKARHSDSMKYGKCPEVVPKKDRDEWPMEMFKEGEKIITAQIMLQMFSTLVQVTIGERAHL